MYENDSIQSTAANGLYSLGISNYLLGDKQSALNYFDQVLSIQERHISSTGLKGLIHYELDRHENASLTLEKFMELMRDLEESQLSPHLLYIQGCVFSIQGDQVRAFNSFSDALSAEPKGIREVRSLDFFIKGSIFYLRKQYYSAINELEKSVQTDDQNAIAWILKGLIEGDNIEDHKTAICDLTRAFKLNPLNMESPAILFSRGIFRYHSNELMAALADFDKVLELNPDYAAAYLLRALAHMLLGNATKTQENVKLFFECNDDAKNKRDAFWNAFSGELQNGAQLENVAHILTSLGDINSGIEKYKTANDSYTFALALTPHDRELYYKRSLVRTQCADYDGSIVDLQYYQNGFSGDSLELDLDFWISMLSHIFKVTNELRKEFPDLQKIGQMFREKLNEAFLSNN